MKGLSSIISSEERIDEVLALANALDLDFGTALTLFRAGHHDAKAVRNLSVEEISRTTGLSLTASERIAIKVGSIDARAPEEGIIEAEVLEGRDDGPAKQARDRRTDEFELRPIRSSPVELHPGQEIQYGTLYHITPGMIKVWVLNGIGIWAFLVLTIIGSLFPLVFLLPTFFGLLFLLMPLVIMLIIAMISYVWAIETYKNYFFGFTKDLVVVKSGIFWKTEIHIPYGRIQNINTHQGIVDRMFEVWHLTVSATGAASIIHGVPDHEAVKAFILMNVEAVKSKRNPTVSSTQNYREVYLVLKSIARNVQSYRSRAIVSHK